MSGLMVVGAGLVGAHVAQALAERGAHVTLLDPRPDERYLARVCPSGKSDLVVGDARDTDLIGTCAASRKLQTIVYCAGPSTSGAVHDEATAWAVHVETPLSMARLAALIGVERFVYVSSFAVYGPSRRERVAETAPLNPATTYGSAKRAAEHALSSLRAEYLDIRIVRPCGVYGPILPGTGSRSARLMDSLARAAVARSTISLPASLVDEFIHANDLGHAIAQLSLAERLEHDVFNVGHGRHTNAEEIISVLRTLVPDADCVSIPGEVTASIPPLDVSRIKEATGFAPLISLKLGLLDLCYQAGVAA